MTISGSGVGGNIGGPQQASQTELEMTAAAAFAKINLGVLKDSSLMPFSDFSRDAAWKYKSGANNPTLSAPLLSVRMASSREEEDVSWKEELLKLLKQLPEDVRERLLRQKKLPPEERSHALYVLDLILGFLAKATVWQKKAVQRLSSESVLEYARYNRELSVRSIQAMVDVGEELLECAETALKKLGPNYRHFDALFHHTQQAKELIKAKQVEISKPNSNEGRAALAAEIADWNAQLHTIETGNELQIIRAVARALCAASVTAAQEEVSVAFITGLQRASIGMKRSDSATASIGSSLEILMKQLQLFLPQAEMAQPFERQLEQLFFGITALTMEAPPVHGNNGTLEERTIKQFLMEMVCNLALCSGIAQKIVNKVMHVCKVPEQNSEALAAALYLTAALLIMESITGKNMKAKTEFLEELSPYLKNWIEAILQQPFAANAPLILLGQIKIALEKQDYQATIALWENMQNSLHFPSGELHKNLNEIARDGALLHLTFNRMGLESELSPTTRIQQVA